MRSESYLNRRPDTGGRRNSVTAVAALIFTVLGLTALGGCNSGPAGIENGGKIDVKYYHLNPKTKVETVDPMIAFEREHYMHGAIDAEQQEARYGNYYTVFWSVEDRSTPVTVRLDYRHAATGTTTNTMELEVADIAKRNRTEFKVVGEVYMEEGKVSSFKVSLVQGGEVVATSESYLWQD